MFSVPEPIQDPTNQSAPPIRPSHQRNPSSWVSFLEMPSSRSPRPSNSTSTNERSSLLPPNLDTRHHPPNLNSNLPFSYSMPDVDQDHPDRSSDKLSRHLNASTVHHRLSKGRLMGSLKMSDWLSHHTPSVPPSPQGRSRSGSWVSSIHHTIDTESRSNSRRWRRHDLDDQEVREELAKDAGNGIRVWYEPYCTIDWLHELIKESIRRKKLSQLTGLYGTLKRTWDKSQAWVLVTFVGIFTAFVADQIVSTEMWLFELKEGYCATGWRTPKRFCCSLPTSSTRAGFISRILSIFAPSILLPQISSSTISDLGPSNFDSYSLNATYFHQYRQPPAAFSPGSFVSQWSPRLHSSLGTSNESCPDWHLWTDLFSSHSRWIEYIITMAFSLFFAALASLLTVYLSRSTQIDTANQVHVDRTNSSSTVTDQQGRRETLLPSAHKLLTSQLPAAKVPPKVSYFAAGSGIPEIKCILSGFVIPGYLGISTMLTKAIGLSLSVGSGLTLGKEGPLVHIACCIGNVFTRLFPKFDRNEGKRREVLSAACAAGVSVAFGAPIGGVLFSLEEVSYFFPPRVMWRSCWCAIVAAAALRVLDPFKTGKTVLFEVTYDRQWHFIELAGFVFLGLIAGVLGASLAKFNVWWSKNFRKRSWVASHPVLEVLLVAFVTCLFAFSNRFMNLAGTELVFEMFAECESPDPSKSSSTSLGCINDPKQTGQFILSLAIAALLKFFLTGVTFGIKCPAGVFIPSLCIGALLGKILGYLVEYAHYFHPDSSLFHFCDPNRGFGQSCIVPGVWAMVGAAAMLAGVTRTTLSLAVIVVEITGSLVYILPVSISIIVAKTMADMIEHRSIYDLVMNLNELPYLDAKSEHLHYAKPEEIMDREAEVIVLKDTLRASDLREIVHKMKSRTQVGSGFPLLETSANGDQRIWGYIGLIELEHGLTMIEDDPLCTFSGADPDVHIQDQDQSADLESSESSIDLGYLVDHAPVTVSNKQSMEVIHEIFVKLGVRYLVVQNYDGVYLGIIEKNRWLRYLNCWNEEHHPVGNKVD